jgi:hypothetical protein
MAGIFPGYGVNANQTVNAVDANTTCETGAELFYPNWTCPPRLDPVAINAVISELLNAVNGAGLQYDCSRLDNLSRAIAASGNGGGGTPEPSSFTIFAAEADGTDNFDNSYKAGTPLIQFQDTEAVPPQSGTKVLAVTPDTFVTAEAAPADGQDSYGTFYVAGTPVLTMTDGQTVAILPPEGGVPAESIRITDMSFANGTLSVTESDGATHTASIPDTSVTGMAFDEPNRQLTLTESDGSTHTAVIPAGGGTPAPAAKYYVFPEDVRADIASGVLADGDEFDWSGFRFKVDRSLDGNAKSFLANLYGDVNYGVVSMDNLPLNFFLKPAFETQDVNKINLLISPDAVRWHRMNKEYIMRGGGDSTIGGRDSQAFWNHKRRTWQLPVTSGTEQNTSPDPYDFSNFESTDLVAFGWQSGLLGNDGVRLEQVDRGQEPVTRQWSNRFYRFEGQQVIITSLEVLPKKTNPFGTEGPALRPYIAVAVDEDNLIFDDPVMLSIGADNEPYLDPDVINWNNEFAAAIKNSTLRCIEVWTTPGNTINDLKTGTWTLRDTIDIDPNDWNSLEGPAWAPYKYIDPADPTNVKIKFRLEVANNRDENDRVIGVPRWTESDLPTGPFDPLQKMESDHAQRNTTVTNLGFVNDPAAMGTLLRAEAVYGGSDQFGMQGEETLRAGTHDLYPLPGFEYVVHGEAGATDVTIKEHTCEYFFLTVKNTAAGAHINVLANDFSRPFTVGGGRQETVLIVWSKATGKYMPVCRMDSSGTPAPVADERKYLTRAAAVSDLSGAANGTIFSVNGVNAVVDSSATGSENAFHDLGGGVSARILGHIINARFFEVGTSQNADDTANLTAANEYTKAVHSASGGAVKFVVAGFLLITSPLDIGQTQEGFEIDMGGAHIEIPAGWTGAATDYALTLRGRAAKKSLPVINCNKRCEGIRFGNNAGSTIIGGAVYRMNSIGFKLSGSNCAFHNQFGYEYFSTDPEFDNDANFTADVIHINSNDFKVVSANVGWAKRPIYLGPNTAEVELIAPHPFNGNPNADGVNVMPRNHPRCIVSDAGGSVYISDLYLDNGYIEDRTGNLRVLSGREFILPNRVTVTDPLFRVNADNDVNTVVDNYEGIFGFYTGAWNDDASNLVDDLHSSASSAPAAGRQRITRVVGRETTILREGGVHFNYAMRGDETSTIKERFRPGTGKPVDKQYSDGVLKLSSGVNGDAVIEPGTLQLYEDGDSGTKGSAVLMKHTGDSGASVLRASASGLLLNGTPVGGSAVAATNEPFVLLGMGQSNMDQNAPATGGVEEVFPGIYALNGGVDVNGNAFAPAAYGTYPFDHGGNSQLISAANLIKQTTGRDVYIILIAEGGRAIECFIKPATRSANGWPAPAKEITPFMYPQIANAIALVPGRTTTTVDAVHWQQGEGNSGDTSYGAKLVDGLIADLVAEGVFATDHGWFTAGAPVSGHAAYAEHKTQVQAQEANVPNLKWVNSVNLPDHDGVHFTGDALLGMGIRHVVQGAARTGAIAVPRTKLEGQEHYILNARGFRAWSIALDGALLPGKDVANGGRVGSDGSPLSRAATQELKIFAKFESSSAILDAGQRDVLRFADHPVGTYDKWNTYGTVSGAISTSTANLSRRAVFNMSGNTSMDVSGIDIGSNYEFNVLNNDTYDFTLDVGAGNKALYANGVRPQDLTSQYAKVSISRDGTRFFITCADYQEL